MAGSRKSRRRDADVDQDDEGGDRGRGRRRKPSGGGRKWLVLLTVGVVLVIFMLLLGVGGFVLWRFMAPGGGPAAIGLPGWSRPRDRLVGRWEADPKKPGNGGLPFGGRLTYDFRPDGNFISAVEQENGQGFGLPDPGTWEVKSENENLVKLKIRRPLTESQRKNFGDDLNSYDLDVEILSDNQIRVTSFKPVAAVRLFDRRR